MISLILPPDDPLIAGAFQGHVEVTDTGTADNRTLTLKILTVADDDLDSYTMVFQYVGDDIFIAMATIILVEPVPPDPALTISGYTTGVLAGQSLSLTCTSTQGKPPAQVTWWKDDVEQQQAVYSSTPDASDQGDAMSVLTFMAVQPANNREKYECRVSQLGTELVRRHLQLNVRYPPINIQVTCSPSDLSDLREGGALECTCITDSNPAARYSWTKNSTALPTGAVVDSTAGTLTFSTLDRTHSGEYRCTASNGISPEATSDSITVDVKYPASITFMYPL